MKKMFYLVTLVSLLQGCEKETPETCKLTEKLIFDIRYGISKTEFEEKIMSLRKQGKVNNNREFLFMVNTDTLEFKCEPYFSDKFGLYKMKLISNSSNYVTFTFYEYLLNQYGYKNIKKYTSEPVLDFIGEKERSEFAINTVSRPNIEYHRTSILNYNCSELSLNITSILLKSTPADLSKYIENKEITSTSQIPNFYDNFWEDVLEKEIEEWKKTETSGLDDVGMFEKMSLIFTNKKVENILIREIQKKASIESKKAENLKKKIKEAQLRQF